MSVFQPQQCTAAAALPCLITAQAYGAASFHASGMVNEACWTPDKGVAPSLVTTTAYGEVRAAAPPFNSQLRSPQQYSWPLERTPQAAFTAPLAMETTPESGLEAALRTRLARNTAPLLSTIPLPS